MNLSRSGTTRRLVVAFSLLILIFGAASYAAMSAIDEIHDSLHEVEHDEQGVRASLELAIAVRDQYAHQAHTIILGDDSHLGFYREARQRVAARVADVRRRVANLPEERAWLDEIDRATAELDGVFTGRIVPAVLARDQDTVEREHGRVHTLVSFIQERADRIVKSFEVSIQRFDQHAHVVQHGAVRRTVVLLGVATLFAIGVGIFISRSVTRPVALLHEGATRLARGDMDAQIRITAPGEFRALAEQFNAMTSALKENRDKLVQSEKLAGIGRLAAGVAHEINNPLGVILGYVRLLVRKADGELAADLKIVEDEAVRCQEIVEGLLDLSRSPRLAAHTVDLRALCDEVVARLAEASAPPATRIFVEGQGSAQGDAQRLRQVLWNLVKNAVEAAGPDGSVALRVTLDEDHSRITVTDSGAGISAANRNRLFEPFFTTKPQGTGLGLAVSRAIANAHGGDIEVGEAPQGGAVFTLRLPTLQKGSV